jgi:hypothetical protein
LIPASGDIPERWPKPLFSPSHGVKSMRQCPWPGVRRRDIARVVDNAAHMREPAGGVF